MLLGIAAVFLLLIRADALTDLLPVGCAAGSEVTTCVNLGNSATEVGKYRSDFDLVKYRKDPVFTSPPTAPANADEPDAYTTLVEKKVLRFNVRVEPRKTFDVTFGIVEYNECDNAAGNVIKITGGKNKVKLTVNPVLDENGGCNTVVQYTVRGVQSAGSGKLSFKFKGTGVVSIGTMCITKHVMSPLFDDCTANNPLCNTYAGCGDYAIINASAAVPSDISPCDVLDTSFSTLTISEPDVFVRRAVLQWAGSGYPSGDSTSVFLNGVSVQSTLLNKNGDFEPYYTAVADSDEVTEIVRQAGTNGVDYVVAGIFHRRFHSCPQAHVAAWSLTIVYEKVGLPEARVNVCAKNTQSNRLVYDFSVGCMIPWPTAADEGDARLTLVAVESDQIIERLRVNDMAVGSSNGFNELGEISGEGFDVITYDMTKYVKNNNQLTVMFKPNDTSHDVVTLAVMNSYQTI